MKFKEVVLEVFEDVANGENEEEERNAKQRISALTSPWAYLVSLEKSGIQRKIPRACEVVCTPLSAAICCCTHPLDGYNNYLLAPLLLTGMCR